MEVRNIISFLKVKEFSSFSKAAEALGYTQSNISSHISQLETELGHPLFDRLGKTISLTEYGRSFLPYAFEIVNSIEQAKLAICDEYSKTKEIRIGLLESLCTTYMPSLVIDLHHNFPNINVIIKIGTFHELSEMLNNNQIDLLWTFDHKINSATWVKALEYEEEICIITSPTHSLQNQSSCDITSLHGSNFIFTEQNCSYRISFENILKANSIAYNIFMEIGNTEIIKKFVHSGLCLSVLPKFAIQSEVEKDSIRILPIHGFSLNMYSQIFYHKNKYLTQGMVEFLDLLNKYFHVG